MLIVFRLLVGGDSQGKLFELDVVEYRMAGQDQGRGEDRVELAAYIGNGKVGWSRFVRQVDYEYSTHHAQLL